jgi:caa(3)-type oxidase subunit IV
MADSPEEIKKHTATYLMVGTILFAGTLATVAVAEVPWLDINHHGFDWADMTLGLIIASIKASLVALIFMHLNHEKKMIYWLFGCGIFFAIAMAALIFLADFDPLHYAGFSDGVFRK